MSLQSTYNSVKGVIADNLESMGVDASSSDGLTTLANKILDIEPSIGGLDLDTAVTLSVSSSTVAIGGSITCTATLTAEYDDETLVDVDLHGVLQNATIKLYEGSTLMTSATTNANGVATLTYTPTSIGTKTIKVVFDGTENFNDCESTTQTITVTQPVVGSIDLVSDKSVLSYADSDTATLTATVYDDSYSALPLEGVTVSFYNGSEFIGTGVSDSNGEATETLYSHGDGNISVSAEVGSVTSNAITIEDCIKYDNATSDKSNKFSFIANPTSSSISHQTDYYAVSYSRTPESNPVKINLAEFVCNGDFEASIDVYYTAGSSRQWTWKVSGNSTFLYDNMSEIGSWSTSRILRTFEGTTQHSTNPSGALPTSTWLTLKFKRENGNISLQIYNGSSLLNEYSSTGWTVSTNTIVGLQMSDYISSFYFKNIKVKQL